MQVGPAVGEGGAGDNRKRRSVFKRQVMARSGSPSCAESRAEGRRTVPCGAELPKSDGRNCPQRIRSEARENGSRGQGRRSSSTAHGSESAALGSLAVRHSALGARADVGGVAGISPLEWGAGDAAAPAWGKSFPQRENAATREPETIPLSGKRGNRMDEALITWSNWTAEFPLRESLAARLQGPF